MDNFSFVVPVSSDPKAHRANHRHKRRCRSVGNVQCGSNGWQAPPLVVNDSVNIKGSAVFDATIQAPVNSKIGDFTIGAGSLSSDTSEISINNNTLSVLKDTDSTSFFGKLAIRSEDDDIAAISHLDMTDNTNYAISQTADGNTSINSALEKNIDFKIGGVSKAVISKEGYVGIGVDEPWGPLHVG